MRSAEYPACPGSTDTYARFSLSNPISIHFRFSSERPRRPAATKAVRHSAICIETKNRGRRSEEHTSELQSRLHLVCRLLLEKPHMVVPPPPPPVVVPPPPPPVVAPPPAPPVVAPPPPPTVIITAVFVIV